MSELNPTPPPIHASIPVPPTLPLSLHEPRPLGDDPAERNAIPNTFVAIEAILRQPRRLLFQMRQPGAGNLIAAMLFAAILCAVAYGVVVGTFSRGEQLWAAPVKIVMGLAISAAICLPSLYIFACLSGAHARLNEVCGLLAGLLLLMTILLIGFAPVAWIFSESTESVAAMGTFHLLFWFVATIFGIRFMKAGFTHAHARSQIGINVWIVIFLLVAMQMTCALRPILGKPAATFFPTEKKFFVGHWFDTLDAATPESSKLSVK